MKLSEFEYHFFPVRIFFAPGPPAWKKLRPVLGMDPGKYPTSDGSVTRFTCDGEVLILVVTLGDDVEKHTSLEVMGLIAHELEHVIDFTEKEAAADFDKETRAYLMQKLIMWACDAFAASGRKPKR